MLLLNGVFMLCYILSYSLYGEARILFERSEHTLTTKKASDIQILSILYYALVF